MSACDNKLKSSLIQAMELDHEKLEAEMQTVTPHTFSDAHQQNMDKLFLKQKYKQKLHSVLRYAVAACIVLLLTSSIFIISSKDLQASKLSIDIIEWLEEFFSTEKGKSERRKEGEVLFEESQIGYLPEGFVKTVEFVNVANVYYRYENNEGNFIQITVGRDKANLKVDNTEDIYEVKINQAGYEYSATYSNETGKGTLAWKNDNEIYYYIAGIAEYEELIKVMNNIF